MKIATKYHGELEVNREEVITFSKGIPGFLEEKKFTLLPLNDEDVFFLLQSLKTPDLAFVIADPFAFYKEYDFNLASHYMTELDITSEKNVMVYAFVTIIDPFLESTINLQAPLILNREQKRGRQIILTGTDYKTKHPLFRKMMK
ncbi:flagellar assembly protein FliW [Priestia endophytica]|uniref:Flagellar assembly factor FliW n=1 Tax=Priestia endophytica TaxID=135735 RepID=A0AAX1Q6J5_9BACI|nr:flagellar assembly protein FliW [Priestia endophytica]MCM3540239.1 flagellar assembly protein FliW [Priestia endophytica]RAS74848.1 flagellar assembly protein FliW [Priestia endophytica]RAS87887.1 flagellar assembly protein FliW [Priestia endophytica]